MRLTREQYDAYLVRHNQPQTRKGCSKEADLHAEIMDYCRAHGLVFFHGAMYERTHRTGGEPDFSIYGPNGKHWLIECKTGTGKLSLAQAAVKCHLESLGTTVHVVRSFQEFLDVIKQG